MAERPKERALLIGLLERGILRNEDLEFAEELQRAGATLDPSCARWGVTLSILLHEGRVAERELLALERELVGSRLSGREEPAADAGALEQSQADSALQQGTAQEAQASSRPETVLQDWERYQILGRVGSGGMGTVYRAKDLRLNRLVALKFIRGNDLELRRRFEQEARAQARILHPGICQVYEVGELGEQLYIAMQLIDGLPLDRATAAMSMTEKVQVIRDVARALHAAHELGIIHRDIKPSNIMVEQKVKELGSPSYWPIIMDFGLAREGGAGKGMTESGAVLGTPSYMSPEQARGDIRKLDRRTDVYSLGATLYDLIVGVPPFDDATVYNILLRVMSEEPKPPRRHNPTIPESLDTIITKCLSKEPEQRYSTSLALAEDLDRFLGAQKIIGRRAGLWYRARYYARQNKPLTALGAALLICVLGLVGYGVSNRLELLRRERSARRQAELSTQLGQAIKDMEWLLRSARQMPLHDLEREKRIVRGKMKRLQQELAGYGEMSRGLGHYALGRGHLALHEYPQALEQLEQAVAAGNQSADVHYALGLVLGKHFEQAMYEARLSGGGEWAGKQMKALEQRYLKPAVQSLQRSREMKTDAPGYLEALMLYYRREYEEALKRAKGAQEEAPWMYEAVKLRGDIHLERALEHRDRGKYEEAEREFGEAVKGYEEAARVGQSDAEVYEGMAEAWVRQIEMAATRGKETEGAYREAVEASGKITEAEPQSVAGPLKKAFAALMTMAVTGAGVSSAERVKRCLAETAAVLARQPDNPYASDVAADCYTFAADGAMGHGEDPEPLFRKALALLEPTVKRHPYFLWGLNDLASAHLAFGVYLQAHGSAQARGVLQKSLDYEAKALALDGTYLVALQNSLYAWAMLISEAQSNEEIDSALKNADELYLKCMKINDKYQQCNINHYIGYARAGLRAQRAGLDPQPRLRRAQATLGAIRKLGGSFLDVEQHTALLSFVAAEEDVKGKRDPSRALQELRAALQRCLGISPQDAMCRTLAAQAERIEAERARAQGGKELPALQRARASAQEATRSPETYPDAWYVLAQAELRLAQAEGAGRGAQRAQAEHLAAALAATEKIFKTNPNHALGRAAQGAVHLLRARAMTIAGATGAADERCDEARAAGAALRQAVRIDPLLDAACRPLLDAACRSLLEEASALCPASP